MLKEDSETSQGEDGAHVPKSAHKSGLKSPNIVVVTQPSADLDKFLVDKFHSKTTSVKPALFESIDLHIPAFSKVCSILHIRHFIFISYFNSL